MRTSDQNSRGTRPTIFKPPGYIYKLVKNQSKIAKREQYQLYHNIDHSLRKYSQTLNMSNQSQLLLYEWRKNTESPVVKVVYLELLNNKTIQTSSSDQLMINVNVFTQHFEKVLADMINLTLSEAIYVLIQCLHAYEELFSKFSAVSINKFLIGLNAQGRLRVWINQNFSANQLPPNESADSIGSEILTVQAAIVNKIIHLIGLLANSSFKFFFYGLEKELQIKRQLFHYFSRFTFNNCLQYIKNFVAKTKNLEIPQNLAYMLPQRKIQNCLEKSNIKFVNQTRVRFIQSYHQKNVSNCSLTDTFKHFGSVLRLGNRQKTQNTQKKDQKQSIRQTISRNKFQPKRLSENLPKGPFVSMLGSKKTQDNVKNNQTVKQDIAKQQYKVSLHSILERNRKVSTKSNEVLVTRKSNISLQRQRPSICILPSFLTKSKHSVQKQNCRNSFEQEKKTSKSHSLKSSKSKKHESLLNSKIGSLNLRKFGQFSRDQILYRTQKPKNTDHQPQEGINTIFKNVEISNLRSRSASANIKFGCYKLNDIVISPSNSKPQQTSMIQNVKSDNRSSFDKSKLEADKTSTNSISNEGTNKNRSFLTKTNYDSITQDNDKNFSYRMDFSSMSIENRITNKNFESDISDTQKQDIKRSLMSFKYGFQQILENPSCKQVQEQNETKSYNGSSLRNTQNIEEYIKKNPKKNQETQSNNFSFGNDSNRIKQRKKLKDSIEQNWDLIKQKNEEFLIKNQWKKTINNLEQLEQLALNQSIVDACSQEVTHKDLYADVRLEKLDRLGKNMCFSIVKRGDDSLNVSNAKKSDVR